MSDTLNNFTDNNPPVAEEEAAAEVTDLANRLTAELLTIKIPLTQESAPLMRDVMGDATKGIAYSDVTRMALQKPFTDRVERIRALFRSPTDRLETIKNGARKQLNAFLAAEDIRIAREALEAREEAERLKKLAEEEAAAAAGNTFVAPKVIDDAKRDAELAELEAKHAEKALEGGPSVGSASGNRAAGFRTTYTVKVVDHRKLVRKFQDHPDVIEAARKLAAAAVRASKGAPVKIPGIELVETKNAV